MTTANPITGEALAEGDALELIPLNLAGLDENELAQLFPSAIQLNGALHIARTHLGMAPQALHNARHGVRRAQKAYRAALEAAYDAAVGSEAARRRHAAVQPAVLAALDDFEIAKIALAYAQDLKSALYADIDILRSLNANLRSEAQR